MVLICLAYVLGLLAVAADGWPARVAALAGLLALAATGVLRSGATALLVLAIAGLGAARYSTFVRPGPRDISIFADGRQARVIGIVADDSVVDGQRLTTTLHVFGVERDGKRWPATGRLWTRFYGVPERERLPDFGDIISLKCFLRRPVESSNSGSFSWGTWLANRGVFAAAYSNWDRADLRYSRRAGGGPVGRAAHAVRHWLVDLIYARYPKAEAASVSGILLGIASEMPVSDRIAFQRTGTYHLLAASGFNCLVIIIVFGRYLFPWLRFHKRQSHAVLIAMLVFYAMVSGGRPSIVRAATMLCLYLLAFLLDRVEDPLNILATAATVILIARPGDFFDAGFRLSFAAAASIIVVAPLLRLWEIPGARQRTGWWRWAWLPARESKEAAAATTAVTLGTTPLAAAYFNYVSLVSIPANALVAFLVLLVFVSACFSLGLGWLPAVGGVVSAIAVWCVDVLLWIVRTFASWEYACVNVRSPGPAAMAGYYSLLTIGAYYASDRLSPRKR